MAFETKKQILHLFLFFFIVSILKLGFFNKKLFLAIEKVRIIDIRPSFIFKSFLFRLDVFSFLEELIFPLHNFLLQEILELDGVGVLLGVLDQLEIS